MGLFSNLGSYYSLIVRSLLKGLNFPFWMEMLPLSTSSGDEIGLLVCITVGHRPVKL